MARPSVLGGLTEALRAVSAWLSGAHVDFAVVGGVAASLHGRPRVTKDVDVVALADDDGWVALVEKARQHQLDPRIDDALEFAKNTRVLLLVHQPSRIEVDVSELVQRAQILDLGKIRSRWRRPRTSS